MCGTRQYSRQFHDQLGADARVATNSVNATIVRLASPGPLAPPPTEQVYVRYRAGGGGDAAGLGYVPRCPGRKSF